MPELTLYDKFVYQIKELRERGVCPKCGEKIFVNVACGQENRKWIEAHGRLPDVEVVCGKECTECDGNGLVEHYCDCSHCEEDKEECEACEDGLMEGCGWYKDTDLKEIVKLCIPEPKEADPKILPNLPFPVPLFDGNLKVEKPS